MNWLPVVGYEGKYEVSNTGLIRKISGEAVGIWAASQGYIRVRLSGPRALLRVHRVVAAAFIPNPQNLPCVNHIDCDRSNNSATNLEWCTQGQNIAHSERLGRMQRDYWKGKPSPNRKLTDEQASCIRSDSASSKISWDQLAKKYGTSKKTIGRIINNQSYIPLPEPPQDSP